MTKAEDFLRAHVDAEWDDGRNGFEWCRLDAYIGGKDHLRVELTWDDDSECEDNAGGERRWLFNPTLMFETNEKVGNELQRKKSVEIEITRAQAFWAANEAPVSLLFRYAAEIAKLRKGSL